MFFKQFIGDDLGCASYMIGDTAVGECAVVDPQWDITDYVQTAAGKGLRIRYVIETHNHADHVSGHGKLAQIGAEVAIFDSAGVAYPHRSLKDGESIQVGSVRLQVLHTPGHRPEHIALTIHDTTRTEEPWLVLTGDCLFVGDVGRPDLAMEARKGATQLYRSLRDKLLTLQDGVELYPAHVSGSLCGKSMSDKSSSTIGFERRYNPALTETSQERFVRRVTSALPPQPPQFARIVERNKGPFFTHEPEVSSLSADEVDKLRRWGALVLDVRDPASFGAGHIPGALNVDLRGGQFGTRASWLIPSGVPVLLVLDKTSALAAAVSSLAAVGQDGVSGYLLGGMQAWDTSGRPLDTIPQITAAELYQRISAGDRSLTILDVREASEWLEGHIPMAIHLPFHRLADHLDEVPSLRPVATICGGGARSSIATSILQAQGFDTLNVSDGMDAWNAALYPLARDTQPLSA